MRPVEHQTPPILQHQPWYKSQVQVQVIASLLTQLGSFAARIAGRFGGDAAADTVADIFQILAIGFGLWAAISRARSEVAPLTLTAASAKKMTANNPPVLPNDTTI